MPASKNFWDRIARRYDAKTVKGPNYAARIERVDTWVDDSAIVLDVGCASGEITLDISPHVKEIHGIDLSAKMIEMARQKASERGIDNARFSQMEPGDANLAEGNFDAVTVYSVIHLFQDIPSDLSRLHDLLRPGGALITETPCLGSWNICWRVLVKLAMLVRMAPLVRTFGVAELESMITDAGFDVVESKVYNPKSGMQCILARKR